MSQPSAQVFPAKEQVEVIQFKRRFKVLREMQSSGVGRCDWGWPGLQDDSCQLYSTNNMAIGINLLLLLLLLLHKHPQHHLVNTTTTSSTSCSCSSSSSTNSSKSSSSTTHSSSSSTTDSSTSSSTTTISTSSHHQWPNPPRRVPSGRPPWLRARPAPTKKKKGAASSDLIDTLTRGRSSKQDVYFLAQGSKDASLTCCRCPAPTLSRCH